MNSKKSNHTNRSLGQQWSTAGFALKALSLLGTALVCFIAFGITHSTATEDTQRPPLLLMAFSLLPVWFAYRLRRVPKQSRVKGIANATFITSLVVWLTNAVVSTSTAFLVNAAKDAEAPEIVIVKPELIMGTIAILTTGMGAAILFVLGVVLLWRAGTHLQSKRLKGSAIMALVLAIVPRLIAAIFLESPNETPIATFSHGAVLVVFAATFYVGHRFTQLGKHTPQRSDSTHSPNGSHSSPEK